MNSPRSVEANLGESVRRLRDGQHLSLRTLAERTGFSASFLSQVENGQASPSISSMERIATALGVTLGQFFQAAESTGRAVVRAESRPRISSDWSKAEIEALGVGGVGTRLDPVMVTLRPGSSSGNQAHPAANEEFALVVEGSVVLTLGDETQTLLPGDSVTIGPGTPRRWQHAGAGVARVVVVSLRTAW